MFVTFLVDTCGVSFLVFNKSVDLFLRFLIIGVSRFSTCPHSPNRNFYFGFVQ